jgi:CRISPR-associated exonuclease Cas4
MWILPVLALIILLVGAYILWHSRRLRAQTGLPAGEVVYTDTGAWETVEQPLLSRRYGLVGRPDYLVRVRERGQESLIPVEVKSGRQPQTADAQPAAGHVLQLGAYCLLVEDIHQQRPAYGLLRYADVTLKIPFTDALRREVLDTAEAIRRARRAPDVPRSHQEPARCRACGYRDACGDQAL